MDFLDLKNYCRLMINDPEYDELQDADMGDLINRALQDLAPSLNTVKNAELSFTDGVASLPADFLAPSACYHGDAIMTEIHLITDKAADTDATSQYFIPNMTQIYIYGQTPTETVTLWYKARPAELTEDDDEPTELPMEFHPQLELYVKAHLAMKLNRLDEYAGLMKLWEDMKKSVATACKVDRHAKTGMMRVMF